jgi:signal peptidase
MFRKIFKLDKNLAKRVKDFLKLDKKLVKRISILAAGFLILGAVSLPFIYGTSTYPVAIVQGNSMYPALQNGDLVLFQSAPQQVIANGTIIIFVQTGTGVSALDSLLKPVLIHRIVGVVVQGDGKVNYQTKGDNNQQVDPELVPASRVLGVPAVIVPKAGLVVMFFQSPQGLVATVGVITFIYIGGSETKTKKEEEKKAFLGALAQMSLNGELPDDIFRKFELAVEYVEDLRVDELKDGSVLALVDWIRKGGLDNEWKVMKVPCSKCSSMAAYFDGAHGLLLSVCPTCSRTGTP